MEIKKIKNFGAFGVSATGVKYPFDINEMIELKKLLKEQLILVLPKINYTVKQCYELSGMLGTIWKGGLSFDEKDTDQGSYKNEEGYPLYPGLHRVTAERTADGIVDGISPGFSKQLNWHCAEVERDKINGKELPLADFVGLHGVKGTEGSVTQVCQMIDRFKQETSVKQQELRDTIMQWGYVDGDEGVLPADPDDLEYSDYKKELYRDLSASRGHSKKQPLVQVLVNGHEGLHFSPSQINGIVDGDEHSFNELKNYIATEYIQDKYIYNHAWQDGDIFYMDQKVCIHRRTDIKGNLTGLNLSQLQKRLLHHIEIYTDENNPYTKR